MSLPGYVTRLNITSSKYLLWQHAFLHALCFVIVMMTPLELTFRTGLFAVIAVGFSLGLPRILRPAVTAFVLRSDGRFATQNRRGAIQKGWLDRHRCRRLVTICLKGRYDSGRQFVLTLYPDAAGSGEQRRLRAWLNWQRV